VAHITPAVRGRRTFDVAHRLVDLIDIPGKTGANKHGQAKGDSGIRTRPFRGCSLPILVSKPNRPVGGNLFRRLT